MFHDQMDHPVHHDNVGLQLPRFRWHETKSCIVVVHHSHTVYIFAVPPFHQWWKTPLWMDQAATSSSTLVRCGMATKYIFLTWYVYICNESNDSWVKPLVLLIFDSCLLVHSLLCHLIPQWSAVKNVKNQGLYRAAQHLESYILLQ